MYLQIEQLYQALELVFVKLLNFVVVHFPEESIMGSFIFNSAVFQVTSAVKAGYGNVFRYNSSQFLYVNLQRTHQTYLYCTKIKHENSQFIPMGLERGLLFKLNLKNRLWFTSCYRLQNQMTGQFNLAILRYWQLR